MVIPWGSLQGMILYMPLKRTMVEVVQKSERAATFYLWKDLLFYWYLCLRLFY